MRLFEFAQDDPLRVKLTAVASQLESRFKNQDQPLPLELFLDILRKSHVAVSEDDIYDIIKKEPLVNIIDSIEGGNIVFKGQSGAQGEENGPDENQKTLQAMASKQTSKF
jgi:hypothetical protein